MYFGMNRTSETHLVYSIGNVAELHKQQCMIKIVV